MYAQSDGIPVIFGSGCTIAVTPRASDFINKITLVDKLINGLGATVKVFREGIIDWNFRTTMESYSEFKSNRIMSLQAKYGYLDLNNTFIKKIREPS